MPAERRGHRRAECGGLRKGCREGRCCVPQRPGPILGHRAPTTAVPTTHLDSSPSGDYDKWPRRPPGYLPPGNGPLPRPSTKERASGRQAKSRGTVHQPGLQSSTEPKGRGRGHHRRHLWVILVKLEQRGLSPPGASSPVSKHFQQTRMGCHPASSSAHHNPLPTSIPLNSFHDALHTTPTLQTCAGA